MIEQQDLANRPLGPAPVARGTSPAVSSEAPFRLGYRPALDGLRAFSILAVMGFHAQVPFLAGGHIGVSVFFVLSGFLITTLLLEEWALTGRIALGAFYFRRAVRLFPALFLLLVVVFFRSFFEPNAEKADAARTAVFLSLAYVSNWARAAGVSLEALDHTWSLAIEEQFYLVWPLTLWLCAWLNARRRVVMLVVLLGVTGSVAVRAFLLEGGWPVSRLYSGTDTRADSLFTGAAVGLIAAYGGLPHLARHARRLRVMAALGACVLVYLAASARWDERYVRMGAESWLSLAVALILVEILLGPSIVTRALLETRPMVWIGGISYGLYIWHFPVFGYLSFQRFDVSPDQSALSVVAVQCLRFAATFAIAGASFYLVERPAARLRTYIGARPRTDWQQHPVRRGSITEQVERA